MAIKSTFGLWAMILCGTAVTAALSIPALAPSHSASQRNTELNASKDLRAQIQLLERDAKLAARRGDLDAEIAAYKQVLAVKPSHVGTYIDLGKAYDAAGMSKEAFESFRLGFDTPRPGVYAHIHDPRAYLRYGELALSRGDTVTAKRAFISSLEGAPDVAGLRAESEARDALTSLAAKGLAYSASVNSFRVGERLAIAQKAYSIAPDSAYVCAVLSWQLHAMRQYKDARSAFDRTYRLALPDQRKAIEAFVNSMEEMRNYTTEETIDANGKASWKRSPRSLENLPLVTPHLQGIRSHQKPVDLRP